PAAGGRGAGERAHHPAGRGHRAGPRDPGHHVHPAPGPPALHAPGHRRVPHELRVHREGEHCNARGAARDHRGGRGGHEAARGLGHHALTIDNCLTVARPRRA
ncbi:unnamed protein product, partial [Heterosigma akashiwo]